MAITYRNARTGRVVSMPEPKEVEASAPNPPAGRKWAVHQRRTIARMDDSRTWQRVADEPPAPAPAPAPASVADEVEPEQDRDDGVYNTGGGWYEVVVDGEVVDKVRGRDAAEAGYAEYAEPTE